MKNTILSIIALCLISSCSKDPRYGSEKLKDGQIVEILLDHKPSADDETNVILPKMNKLEWPLWGFNSRMPGYTYKVKAKFLQQDLRAADGPEARFEFLELISKEKYSGTESFTVQLLVSFLPGGPSIRINKTNDKYFLNYPAVELSYKNDVVKNQLEEIWQEALLVRNNVKQKPDKWTQIKATVTHDPNKFGEAYLVEKIELL